MGSYVQAALAELIDLTLLFANHYSRPSLAHPFYLTLKIDLLLII